MMSEQTYYTLTQAAGLLGVHYDTVARWVRTGKLAGVKLSPRRVVIPKERLDAYLAGDEPAADTGGGLTGGSPQAWLALAGTLTDEEAEQILAYVEERFEQVEATT
jgi:excisionase family DNA binding protein